MSTPAVKKNNNDSTRLGEHSATQPLSGIAHVNETYAVNGLGRGAFVRREETGKAPASKH
ncbi:MAG: hypothetical protein AB7H77_02200 [Bdellovibrionales bacterium]